MSLVLSSRWLAPTSARREEANWRSTRAAWHVCSHRQACCACHPCQRTSLVELNTDFSTKGLSAQDLVAVVQAWQSGALSRDTMLDLFRRGEILPEGRSNEDELRRIASASQPAAS